MLDTMDTFTHKEYVEEDTIIDLNVGGKFFSTFKSTLTNDKDSKLSAMVKGNIPANLDDSGKYFIDCDPEIFSHILEYLRFRKLPPHEMLIDVYEYATYFHLRELKTSLEKFKDVQYKRKCDLTKSSLDKEKYEQLLQEILNVFFTSRNNERKYICIVTVQNITDNLKECKCPELYLTWMNMNEISAKASNPPIKTELQNNDANLLQALAGDLKLYGYNGLRYNNKQKNLCPACLGVTDEHLMIVLLDEREEQSLAGVPTYWMPL